MVTQIRTAIAGILLAAYSTIVRRERSRRDTGKPLVAIPTHLVYLDTETTGLDPAIHQVWEIAYAVDDGPIHSAIVDHNAAYADQSALEVGHYHERMAVYDADWLDDPTVIARSDDLEDDLYGVLNGATIVGANPAFDAAILSARWDGEHPWHYRLLDIEVYAMPALGYDRPQGLITITQDLRALGFDIPLPDHTAAGDVTATRSCHWALVALYRRLGVTPPAPTTKGPDDLVRRVEDFAGVEFTPWQREVLRSAYAVRAEPLHARLSQGGYIKGTVPMVLGEDEGPEEILTYGEWECRHSE